MLPGNQQFSLQVSSSSLIHTQTFMDTAAVQFGIVSLATQPREDSQASGLAPVSRRDQEKHQKFLAVPKKRTPHCTTSYTSKLSSVTLSLHQVLFISSKHHLYPLSPSPRNTDKWAQLCSIRWTYTWVLLAKNPSRACFNWTSSLLCLLRWNVSSQVCLSCSHLCPP